MSVGEKVLEIFFLIGVIPLCCHLNILRVGSVKTQLIDNKLVVF